MVPSNESDSLLLQVWAQRDNVMSPSSSCDESRGCPPRTLIPGGRISSATNHSVTIFCCLWRIGKHRNPTLSTTNTTFRSYAGHLGATRLRSIWKQFKNGAGLEVVRERILSLGEKLTDAELSTMDRAASFSHLAGTDCRQLFADAELFSAAPSQLCFWIDSDSSITPDRNNRPKRMTGTVLQKQIPTAGCQHDRSGYRR